MWKIELFDVAAAAFCTSLFCVLEYLHRTPKESLEADADKLKLFKVSGGKKR